MRGLSQLPRYGVPLGGRTSALKAGDYRIRGHQLTIIRERIFSRAQGMCECVRCAQQPYRPMATIVDHIVPLWAGGREHDSNRQAISKECHDLKSAHEQRCRDRGEFVPWRGEGG